MTNDTEPRWHIRNMMYTDKLGAGLSPAERRIFVALDSPKNIQNYLETRTMR